MTVCVLVGHRAIRMRKCFGCDMGEAMVPHTIRSPGMQRAFEHEGGR